MKHHFLSTLGAVIFLDQLTKYLATRAGAVHLNQGISLGLADTNHQALLSLVIISIMVILWLWRKELWKKYPVIAGFLFGGSISNVLDRILFAGVRDWLPVPGFNLTNNIADWSITLSLAAILLLEIQASQSNNKEKIEHGN